MVRGKNNSIFVKLIYIYSPIKRIIKIDQVMPNSYDLNTYIIKIINKWKHEILNTYELYIIDKMTNKNFT